jgi:hypothetical protein
MIAAGAGQVNRERLAPGEMRALGWVIGDSPGL